MKNCEMGSVGEKLGEILYIRDSFRQHLRIAMREHMARLPTAGEKHVLLALMVSTIAEVTTEFETGILAARATEEEEIDDRLL